MPTIGTYFDAIDSNSLTLFSSSFSKWTLLLSLPKTNVPLLIERIVNLICSIVLQYFLFVLSKFAFSSYNKYASIDGFVDS